MEPIGLHNRSYEYETESRSAMTLGVGVRLIVFSIIGVVTYFAFTNGITLFSWHPTLMLIGILFLMTEAILSFSSENFLTRSLSHVDRVALHWKLQAGAATTIFLAFLSIFCNKNRYDKEHFTTWHGYFGLWTCMLILGTIGGGAIAKYSYQMRHIVAPVIVKSIHSAFGIGSYILALFTLCLGLSSDWMHGHVTGGLIYVFVLCVFLVGFYVLVKPTLNVVERVKK